MVSGTVNNTQVSAGPEDAKGHVLPGPGPKLGNCRGGIIAVMLAHPWAPLLVVSRITVGPNTLRYIDATRGTLRQAGLSWAETDRAWNAIDSHIYGFTLQLQKCPVDPAEYAAAAASYLPMLPAEQYPYMRELTARVAEGTHAGTHDFAFGLELILDGLDRLRPPRWSGSACGCSSRDRRTIAR